MDKNSVVLIHVGYYKTGTTWLQKNVFGTGKNGFTPLSIGMTSKPKKASKYLGTFFCQDSAGKQLSAFDFDVTQIDRFVKSFMVPDGTVGVVSNERLLGYFFSNGNDALSIRTRLKEAFPNAKILITVRRQHEMIFSCYLQYLKRGGRLSLGKLLASKHDNRLSLFSKYYFDYHYAVRAYAEAFGKQNVLVLPYEFFLSNPDQYVRSIYEHVNLDYGSLPTEFNFQKRENASRKIRPQMSLRHISGLFDSNSLNFYSRSLPSPYRIWLEEILFAAISKVTTASSEFRARKQLNDTIKAHLPQSSFADSNKILQQYVPIDIAQFGYY